MVGTRAVRVPENRDKPAGTLSPEVRRIPEKSRNPDCPEGVSPSLPEPVKL